MRIVRNDVEHVWIHEQQSHARNRQGSVFFEHDTIYSYGHHFPIARIVRRKNAKAVLFTTEYSSNTTAKHKSYVRAAIPAYIPVFYVENPTREPSNLDLDDYQKRVDSVMELAVKARTRKGEYFANALALVESANEFAQFFGLRRRLKPPVSVEEAAKELAEGKRKAEARRKREETRREREQAERLSKWLAGEPVNGRFSLEYQRMRVVGDQVQTTMGVSVPLDSVKRVSKIVLDRIRKGKTYKRNGERIDVSSYTLEAITSEGTVIVGCHRFKREEIERVAKLLGV